MPFLFNPDSGGLADNASASLSLTRAGEARRFSAAPMNAEFSPRRLPIRLGGNGGKEHDRPRSFPEGRPMAKPIYVTTQRTSKKFKALLLIANVIQLFGAIIIIAGLSNQDSAAAASGFSILVGGIALHVFGRVLIWWNND
jgi:hypothetical protein